MTNSRTNQPNGSMTRAEAEETLGRAARIETDSADRLRVGELVDAGKEVGISEASVHQALLDIGFSTFQGFLFHQPEPVADFLASILQGENQ